MEKKEQGRTYFIDAYLKGEDSPQGKALFDHWFSTPVNLPVLEESEENIMLERIKKQIDASIISSADGISNDSNSSGHITLETEAQAQIRSVAVVSKVDVSDVDKEELPLAQTSGHLSDERDSEEYIISNRISFKEYWRLAACILAVLIITGLVWQLNRSGKDRFELAYLTKQNHTHQPMIISLPDSTLVTLHPQAQVRYPEHFKGKFRTVSLQGKAYFEVTKNKKMPFQVQLHGATIQVLGTAFNVSQLGMDSCFTVSVDEGKVHFSTSYQRSGVILTAGMVANAFPSDSVIRTRKTTTGNYQSWRRGGWLSFDEIPLKEVVEQLSEIYQSKIILEGKSLDQMSITAELKLAQHISIDPDKKTTIEPDLRTKIPWHSGINKQTGAYTPVLSGEQTVRQLSESLGLKYRTEQGIIIIYSP